MRSDDKVIKKKREKKGREEKEREDKRRAKIFYTG
jgi:hypothetical protein